ncbi:pyridine nucleotide-disulfide oxidoreductase domain-containing protein 2-like isoform X1 [Hibiscus syriacus]|uniref:Pyridine nucleotide-disulfide oxidoreductase domain-containing protein 2-like isoform X1 n=1 Tax=Hibiscus syriacus TaxID=106335 RepID=A0A6A3AVI7_HIBSY|nr:protein N-lysine methyltransferase METTL21A-like [Hibiscus syriacus]KAE8707095.1 pyridine nucleotide-disulfide oxidoreductase domain-containing protein 2-like isoform X1 [Hibiscus syriacus]
MATLEDDEVDIDPFKIILPDEEGEEKKLTTLFDGAAKPQLQKHYIRSIKSMVVIRQLPSEGLSFQLWPAATALVKLLDDYLSHLSESPLATTLTALSNGSENGRKLKILELGSGTGLVGIAAAVTIGANVTMTDLPHVIPNLKFNADANADVVARRGGTVDVTPLRWGEANDMEVIGREFDLVLASDVVYHDHLFEPLIQTLRFLLNGGARGGEKKVFVMAHLRRWKKDSTFFKKAKKLFDVEVLHTDPPKEGSRIGVVVYAFVGKI